MNGPFPLAAVIARARAVEGLRQVGNAADLEAAKHQAPSAAPAVYVLSEEAGEAERAVTGKPIQSIQVTLKLVMWVRNAGGAERVVADMAALESGLRAALFGWRPSPEFTPFTVRLSGQDQGFGSHLVRQLLLTTRYRQTSETQP